MSNRRREPTSTLLAQVARLVKLIADADLPPSVSYLLIGGSLTAIHKDDRATQATNAATGTPDPVRSINSGSTFLKQGLRCMTKHKSFDEVKAVVSTVNYGLGFRSGPEVMAHLTRALVAGGYAVNTQDDAIKGFYRLLRQALLDGVDELWPEANKHFEAYYGPAAPCVYSYKDEAGNQTARVSFSTEGTRAGCVLGSAGFDIALHHFVYRHLVAEFPSFTIKALTDDMPSFFTAQTDDD